MSRLMYRSASGSDVGRVRGNNEDRVYRDDNRGLYLVIDGVGGESGGERAAAIAENELLARLERSTGTIEDRIREGIALAGRRIFEQAQRNPELAGMACVLTVAVLVDGEAVVGHVGDTRLYKIRRGSIAKITPDHSPVGVREDAGEISEAEAMHHPRRNEIFRDVGSGERRPDDEDFIDIIKLPVESDCALLLCSDGLSDQVSSSEILKTVEENAGHPGDAARALIQRANEAGGKDNVSVVCVEGPDFAPRKPLARARLPLAAALVAGILLGALAMAGYSHFFASEEPPPRILRVTPDGKGEFASIETALAGARPGDIIEVPPGTYREQIVMKEGVHLLSRPPGQAIIQARPDATQAGAAVILDNIRSGSLTGFRIAATEPGGLSIGVLATDSGAELQDLEIEGAAAAGILVRGTAMPVIRASYIHNNAGAGIRVEDTAAPRLISNLIVNNGRAGIEVAAAAKPVLLANVLSNGKNLIWEGPGGDAEARKLNLLVEPPAPPKPRQKRK